MTSSTMRTNNPQEQHSGTNPKILLWIGAALLAAFLVSRFIVSGCRVVGPSMEPALSENSWVLLSRSCRWGASPARGDIIVFEKPQVTRGSIVKRVVAVPGDTVEIRAGTLFLNGTAVKEERISMPRQERMSPCIVPQDGYFVLGDNRGESSDSRHWQDAFVKREEIQGKVLCEIFPKPSGLENWP